MSAADLPALVGHLLAAPRERNGERVVTFDDIDHTHGRPKGTARKRFNDHRFRFVEGRDFFASPMAQNGQSENSSGCGAQKFYEFTERGYLKLTKPMSDDLAWQVADMLVDAYFRARDVAPALRGVAAQLACLEAEVAQARADVKSARADTFKLAVKLSDHRSDMARTLGAGLDPKFKILSEEDPDQGRIFLTYSQIIEDRARLAAGRVTSTEAAALLGVTVRQLGRMAKDGKVERRHPGTRRPYLIEHVQRALVPAGESVAS